MPRKKRNPNFVDRPPLNKKLAKQLAAGEKIRKKKHNRRIALNAYFQNLTPLDYMLGVLRNPHTTSPRRDDMAKSAAPYVHPRLSTNKITQDPDAPFKQEHKV